MIKRNKQQKRPIRENRALPKKLKALDKYLLGAILFLILFGLLMLFSASLVTAHSSQGDAYFYIKKQIASLIIGLPLLFLLTRIDYRKYKKFSLFFLGASILLLIFVFIPGLKSDYGTANSWINIFGWSFQVSEAVKLFLIFYLSAWVGNRREDLKVFVTGLLPFFLVVLLVGILILFQPDLGAFILIFLISLSIYFVAGGNIKYLVIMALILLFIFSYLFLNLNNNSDDSGSLIKSYQLDRIRCLQNSDYDKDICYQVNQSLIAAGSGGLWGRGIGNSRQKFNYLPEVWADSIFPVIAEEIGFVGSIFLILIYLFIFIKGIIIAKRAPDIYGRSLATGISVWIFLQAFLNMGGMLNLIPMTGVTLPFISAGGTSLLVLLSSCGILLNISRQTLDKSNDNIEV